jgi:hypothetical protein
MRCNHKLKLSPKKKAILKRLYPMRGLHQQQRLFCLRFIDRLDNPTNKLLNGDTEGLEVVGK